MNELRKVLTRFEKEGAALGHFNVADLVLLKAVLAAAGEIRVPVLVGASEGERDFFGTHQVAALVIARADVVFEQIRLRNMAASKSVPPELVLVNSRTAVETPVYGLNTPPGREITASSFCCSTSVARSVLCAVLDPNKTPSGTMTAARPPGLRSRRKSARNSNSVFFVLTT